MLIEKQTGKKIKHFKTNNSLKFYKGEFDKFYKNKGIVRYRIVRKVP